MGLWDEIKHGVHSVEHTVVKDFNKAEDSVEHVFKSGQHKASQAINTVEDKVSDTYQEASKTLSRTAEEVKTGLEEGFEKSEQYFQQISDKVEDEAKDLGKEVVSISKTIGDDFQKAVDFTGKELKEGFEETEEFLSDSLATVKEAVEETYDEVKNITGKIADGVEDGMRDVLLIAGIGIALFILLDGPGYIAKNIQENQKEATKQVKQAKQFVEDNPEIVGALEI